MVYQEYQVRMVLESFWTVLCISPVSIFTHLDVCVCGSMKFYHMYRCTYSGQFLISMWSKTRFISRKSLFLCFRQIKLRILKEWQTLDKSMHGVNLHEVL